MYMFTHIYIHIHMYIHILCMYTHVYIYMYMYICINTYIYICILMYIHTYYYTHIHIFATSHIFEICTGNIPHRRHSSDGRIAAHVCVPAPFPRTVGTSVVAVEILWWMRMVGREEDGRGWGNKGRRAAGEGGREGRGRRCDALAS